MTWEEIFSVPLASYCSAKRLLEYMPRNNGKAISTNFDLPVFSKALWLAVSPSSHYVSATFMHIKESHSPKHYYAWYFVVHVQHTICSSHDLNEERSALFLLACTQYITSIEVLLSIRPPFKGHTDPTVAKDGLQIFSTPLCTSSGSAILKNYVGSMKRRFETTFHVLCNFCKVLCTFT